MSSFCFCICFFSSTRDSSKNIIAIAKKENAEIKIESMTTVTFVENAGGLEKSKSDSKINQVFCMKFFLCRCVCECFKTELLIA